MKKIALGCDFGATWIKAGLVSQTGSIISEIREETKAFLGQAGVLARLELIILTLLQRAKNQPVLGLGLGSPGPIDFAKGLVKNPPNLPGWRNVPLKNILSKKFHLPLFLDNDANCALLGEQWRGAAKGRKNAILLTVGTGIGGAALINGEIYRGASGAASEFGHIIIDKSASEKCGCGHYGCLESLASATAMSHKMKKVLNQGRKSAIHKSEKIDSLAIYQAAKKGDKLAIEVLTDAGRNLGLGVKNLINIFEPEVIVISGQLVKAQKYFWPAMRKEVKKNCLIKGVPMVKAKLGDNAGLLGAAFMVFKSSS